MNQVENEKGGDICKSLTCKNSKGGRCCLNRPKYDRLGSFKNCIDHVNKKNDDKLGS